MIESVFGPGETLTYRVRYGFIETARATVEVGKDRRGNLGEVWPITLDASTTRLVGRLYSLDTHFVTHYLPREERTLGFDRDSEERGGLRVTRVRLDPRGNKAVVIRETPGEPAEQETYDTGPARHDIASAIFWLRDRPLNVGDVERVRIFTGRKAWDLVATVIGLDRVRTSSGRMEAKLVRLKTYFEGQAAAKRDIEVWMTNDDHHIPVALRADLALGSLRADLLDYSPPSGMSHQP